VEKNLEASNSKKDELMQSLKKNDFEGRKADLEDRVQQVSEANSEVAKKDEIIRKLRAQLEEANDKSRK